MGFDRSQSGFLVGSPSLGDSILLAESEVARIDVARENMMRNQGSVEIDCPIEDVFDLTSNRVSEWSIVVVEDEALDEKPEGVGTTFRSVSEDHGRRIEFQGVVTGHEPPYFSAIRLTGDTFDIDVEYTFEELEHRTRVTQRSEVTAKGFFRVLLFLCGWMMRKSSCKALQKELDSLKQFCESQ